MRKFSYFILSLVTVLMASCTDHDAYMTYEEYMAAKYEMAFTNEFGTIDPNHTWGFGNVTTGTRAVATRAIEVGHGFATAPNDADFATTIPSNAELITGYKDGTCFYIDESINGNGKTIQPNGSGISLYVKGDVKPTDIYTPANTTIYLLPNSKLTIPSNRASFGQNYTHIYIAEGAELIVQGGTAEFGYGVKVYNRGKIVVDNITISNTGLVYNEGTIDISGKIKVSNNNSELVNDGTLKAANLGTEGSGHVQNNATAIISNETLINSNNNTWVNNGNYTTGNFTYQAGGNDVANNCLLTVTEKFYINLGDTDTNGFRLDGEAGVVTKDFEGAGPFYIQMGGKSVFKVTGTATMHSTKKDYGFYGVGSDYAVLEATKIVKGGTNQGFEVTYGGNLIVSTDDHFAQGHDGDENHPFTYIKDNAKVYAPGYTDGKTEIVIPETKCNPGFGKATEDKIKEQGRVFCEDLGSIGDFDFNDVVFDAYIYESGKVIIVLQAAGGILPITVAGEDVHARLGEGMVNTGDGPTHAPDTIVTSGYATINDIPVVVSHGEALDVLLVSQEGKAPQKICVPLETKWMIEYKNIKNGYKKFGNWVGNSGIGDVFTDETQIDKTLLY